MGRYESDGETSLLERWYLGALRRYRDSVTRVLPTEHVVIDQYLVVAGQHVRELVLAVCIMKNDFTDKGSGIAFEFKTLLQ